MAAGNREIELLVTNQSGKTTNLHIKPGTYLMGLGRDCQIRFPAQSRGISPRHTLAAAVRLTSFDRPALIAWGTRDRFFPLSDAERLARTLPCSELVTIENARTFVQLDQPQRLAELVANN